MENDNSISVGGLFEWKDGRCFEVVKTGLVHIEDSENFVFHKAVIIREKCYATQYTIKEDQLNDNFKKVKEWKI